MAQVIALSDYKERFGQLAAPQLRTTLDRPVIRGEDIWCRKFDNLDSIVFGLLKVREIVNYYAGYKPSRDHMFMDILDAAYHAEEGEYDPILDAIRPVKQYILDNTPEEDRKHMLLAIVVLDLIEKTLTKGRLERV